MTNLSLLTTTLIATYLSQRCFRSPNPVPTARHDDVPGFDIIPSIRAWTFLLLQLPHIFIIATQSLPKPSAFCPNPAHLKSEYFTWSPWTLICLLLILAAAPVRLLAFRELGRSFTFQLAKPDRLITTGIYRYVQHPSYPPDCIISVACFALFANLDGWPGCFLPYWLIELWKPIQLPGLVPALGLYLVIISARVRKEEAMMKETFGKEWEEWHSKTARIIPGVY